MTIKAFAICLLVVVCSYFLYDLYMQWSIITADIEMHRRMAEEVAKATEKAIRVEGSVGAAKVAVELEQDTPWHLVVKAVATILSTTLGIKLINKYVK